MMDTLSKMVKIYSYLLMVIGTLCAATSFATESTSVSYCTTPVIVGRSGNVVAEICIDNSDGAMTRLDRVGLRLGGELQLDAISSVGLFYSGTASTMYSRTTSWAMKDQFKRLGGSMSNYISPSYAIKKGSVESPDSAELILDASQTLFKGKNYFYISVRVDNAPTLADSFRCTVTQIELDSKSVDFCSEAPIEYRLGVAVRQSGDDGVYGYRIPGLATTLKGTLLGIYDVRHTTSLDLQDDVDVGLSRSIDGGRSWQKMRVIIDMGEWGGLPESQNGVGDASILVDNATGEIFVVGVWVHGIGNNRAWDNVGQGFAPQTTAQLMMVSSVDDGQTWSQPVNITSQVKDSSWRFTLQGPGRGITMSNGTLVFPIQHIDAGGVPNAGIMYSTDHGRSWKRHNYAKSNTTESQVAEIEPGVLMLNMRDNRKTGRAVYVTRDMGRSWSEHSSSGYLREPVCMASLLHVPAAENIIGRDILLFSNPDTTKGRSRMTIKASLDGGATWLDQNTMLIDQHEGWGYSCLTMIDKQTVGILYEGSVAQMLFQAIKLTSIVKQPEVPQAWQPIAPIDPKADGYNKGVSAMCAAAIGSDIVVAGGANFADKEASEGGAKCYYDNIYRMKTTNGRPPHWVNIGRLPEKMAYGVSFAVGQSMVIAGGRNQSAALSSVWRLEFAKKSNKVSIKPLPKLPFAIEQAAGVAIGQTLYMAGGVADGSPSSRLLVCDLSASKPQWRELSPLPEPMLQPAMTACAGKLYLWGGFVPSGAGVDPKVIDYGYCYDPISDLWQRIAGPGTTMTGASVVTLDQGTILCAGGVDPEVFLSALIREQAIDSLRRENRQSDIKVLVEEKRDYMLMSAAKYKFNTKLYAFDVATGSWSTLGQSGHTARAGAALVVCGDNLFSINGEIKPGVRSVGISCMKLKR